VGEVVLEYAGMRATTKVVFALEDDVEVLSVHVLKVLGLEVDPTARELK
jgi:predicted aspartyl protease